MRISKSDLNSLRGKLDVIVGPSMRLLEEAEPKPNKYRAKRTQVGGLWFDSKREAECWVKLRAMEKAGVIRNLQRQVPFSLEVNGHVIGKFVADFTYDEGVSYVVGDAKGVLTPLYRRNRKHMLAQYGIKIVEM